MACCKFLNQIADYSSGQEVYTLAGSQSERRCRLETSLNVDFGEFTRTTHIIREGRKCKNKRTKPEKANTVISGQGHSQSKSLNCARNKWSPFVWDEETDISLDGFDLLFVSRVWQPVMKYTPSSSF